MFLKFFILYSLFLDRGRHEPQKGPEIRRQLKVTLIEILHGTTKVEHFKLFNGLTKSIHFIVKPGIHGGMILHEPNAIPLPNGAFSDVKCEIVEIPHLDFQRVGNDLVKTVPISNRDAILPSCKFSIKTLESCIIREIPGNEWECTIPGEGLPHWNGSGKRGNLQIVKKLYLGNRI